MIRKLTTLVLLSLFAFGAGAVNITVKNFDEDLATVYVNGTATTNGQVVAVDGNVTVELKDFRNDYYYRFAPAEQTDRSMALESWEGVPSGYETQNPATFTPEGDYTVTANVDVKGYCWQVVTNAKGTPTEITNHFHRYKWNSAADATRLIALDDCITNVVGATENNLTADFVERVRYKDKNYTITSLNNRYGFYCSRMGTLAISPRFSYFPYAATDKGTGCTITNIVGMWDVKSLTVRDYAFYYGVCNFNGPVTNFVARRSTSIGSAAYGRRSGMTGELLLETIVSLDGFSGCTGLTAARLTSPYLTTLGAAFSGLTGLGEVTIGSSILSSVSTSAFKINTAAAGKTANGVTNFVFLADAPAASMLDNMLNSATAVDGAHACKLTVDAGRSSWWSRVTAASDAEVAAGLPANCMGVYVDASSKHKAWIVSSNSLNGVLLEGDMTMLGTSGYVPRTGLEVGSQVALAAPEGFDICELQHLVGGNVWTTYLTTNATSFTYTHQGELTRAVWRVDGATLSTFVNDYGGSIAVEVVSGQELASGVYKKGSVLRVSASGQTTHPTSHFTEWTEGVTGDDATNDTILVTMDEDTVLRAEFYPDEWIYSSSAKTITDGEWTCTATLSGGKITVSSPSGGQNYMLWLDLSLPVLDAKDYVTTYTNTALSGSRNVTVRKVRFGPMFETLPYEGFRCNTVLERLDGIGASKVTAIAYCLMYEGVGGPIKNEIYEANDFLPVDMTRFNNYCWGWGPYLTGTLELRKLKNFGVTDDAVKPFENYSALRAKLYHSTTAEGRVIGITNLLLTCEALAIFPKDLFASAHLESVTIASTNLTTAESQAFTASASSLKEIVFLAHAPATVAALDNLVKAAKHTNMVIRCSKHAPGWKAMRMANDVAQPEWSARPAGTWGMYQTLDGKKRYYMVQKDSKYDHRDGLMVIVK